MNISNGHNSAQGRALPEKHNTGAFAYGLSEDGFGKLTRARNACDMLQLLFSEYPSQVGALDAGCAPGVAALMEYGVRKAAQEVAQVLNVPDVQELPVKPARQKAPNGAESIAGST